MSSPIRPKNPHQSHVYTALSWCQQAKANEIERLKSMGLGTQILARGCCVWVWDCIKGQKTYAWIFDSKALMGMGLGIMVSSIPRTVAIPVAFYGAYKVREMLDRKDRPDTSTPNP